MGRILGNAFNKTWAEMILLSFDAQETLGLILMFGYILFLFNIRVKTNMSMVHRTGRTALNIGSIAILAPPFYNRQQAEAAIYYRRLAEATIMVKTMKKMAVG
ncbi:cation/H(+) antiporter 4-like [Senna tora]|uniref:Cation/H(+) antiporter 4-like n=1 Tax=Senna tora TaxID=362788 RepID=A0A834TIZ2_9FABA|nr:cation/H(+) antiporter 4-like [Senna tora]